MTWLDASSITFFEGRLRVLPANGLVRLLPGNGLKKLDSKTAGDDLDSPLVRFVGVKASLAQMLDVLCVDDDGSVYNVCKA